MKTSYLSACGQLCDECSDFLCACMGCSMEQGRPPGKRQPAAAACPPFVCSQAGRGLRHCGRCRELPCSLFQSLGNPKEIDQRIARLKAENGSP